MDCIIFFSRTGVTRIFSSYNLAEQYYPGMAVMVRPIDLMANFNLSELRQAYDRLIEWGFKRKAINKINGLWVATNKDGSVSVNINRDDLNHSDLSKLMWSVMVLIGNRVEGKLTIQSEEKASTRDGISVDIDAAKHYRGVLVRKEEKQPKQVQGLLEILINEQFDFYTKQDLQRLMETPRAYKQLETKQSGWRIFRYYRNVLKTKGVISE